MNSIIRFLLQCSVLVTLSLLGLSGVSPQASAQSLEEALDAPGLIWIANGQASWYGQTEVTHDGVDAARSGFLFAEQESTISTGVTGPGVLAFTWKVSSEEAFDFLEFDMGPSLVAPTMRARIAGEVDWERRAFNVPAGVNTIQFRFAKDSFVDGGQDAAWLDDVVFVPNSGPPVIVIHPQSQNVVTGLNLTLTVNAGGAVPLTYQWLRNETEPINGATASSLPLNNIQPSQASRYRVVVSNSSGSVTSSVAEVNVSPTLLAANVLVFVDHELTNPFLMALDNRLQAYQFFNDANLFNEALGRANPLDTLAIFDSALNFYDFYVMRKFVRAGGRALVQYWSVDWSVDTTANLSAAFNATPVSAVFSPLPLYHWSASPLFEGVRSPMNMAQTAFNQNGNQLRPTAGGRAIAGYTVTSNNNSAALVIGNAGRTILHGFILENMTSTERIKFAENELEFLTGQAPDSVPSITKHPHDVAAVEGATALFEVTATGTKPLHYQWRKDGVDLPNATNAVLEITPVKASDENNYEVEVSNRLGSITSGIAFLRVTSLLPLQNVLFFSDTLSPAAYNSALANLGLNPTVYTVESAFNVDVETADPGNSLVIVQASLERHGFDALRGYIRAGGRAIVQYWNLGNGSALADALEVAVGAPFDFPLPVYDWESSRLFTALSNPLTLMETGFMSDGNRLQTQGTALAAAGFQPQRTPGEGALVLGNSGRTLVHGFLIEDVSPPTDATQLAQNEVSFLNDLANGPLLLSPPRDQTVLAGATVEFRVVAMGQNPFRYQWQFNGSDLANATNALLTVANAQTTHQGRYSVLVSNPAGSTQSPEAQLTVRFPPRIEQQPQSTTVMVGADVSFTVVVSNTTTLPLSYQWRKLTTPLTNMLLNSYTSTFTLYRVQASAAGLYRVLVTNEIGQAASASATLTVLTSPPPPTISLLAPSAGATFGCDTTVPLRAAAEGSVLRVEFYAGTELLGSVASAPYELAWPNVRNGSYSLTARAVTQAGLSSTSAPINITVNATLPSPLRISRVGPDIVLSWAQSCGDYHLQENNALDPAQWTPSQVIPTSSGERWTATIPVGSGRVFYRLRKD